jgi:glutathione S-transferase
LAQHLGIALEIERLPLDTPEFRSRVLSYTPTGRVPVLMAEGVAIPESTAILETLSEMADGRGWPTDRYERARARALVAEMHAGFSALRNLYPMNIRARNRHVPMTDALAADICRIDAIFASRHGSHSGPWLFGAYSAADAMYLPVALRFSTYGADGLSDAAQRYIETAVSDPLLIEWTTRAIEETEFIDHEEVGL